MKFEFFSNPSLELEQEGALGKTLPNWSFHEGETLSQGQFLVLLG